MIVGLRRRRFALVVANHIAEQHPGLAVKAGRLHLADRPDGASVMSVCYCWAAATGSEMICKALAPLIGNATGRRVKSASLFSAALSSA